MNGRKAKILLGKILENRLQDGVKMKKIVFLPIVCFLFISLTLTADAGPPVGADPADPEYDEYHEETVDDHDYHEEGLSMDHDDPVSMADDQDSPWPFGFTDAQMHRLKQLGCRFDHNDLVLARRLAARGFGAREFVQAYEDSRRILGDTPPHMHLENLVVFRHVGLPINNFNEFLAGGQSLTDYYNSRIGGRGNVIAGAILLGSGLPPLGLGILFLALGSSAARRGEDTDSRVLYTVGAVFAVPGVILSGIGIPLLVIGREKLRRWAPERLMEQGDSRRLYDYRVGDDHHHGQYSSRSRGESVYHASSTGTGDPMTLYMSPSILPGGGGLNFSLTW